VRASILAACLVLAAGAACGTGPATATPPPTSNFLSDAELTALGVRVVALEGGSRLVCGGPAEDTGCVCLEPLPCEASGDCVTFDASVRAFREAVTAGQEGRKVQCNRAEIGRCGPFRFFDFEGDIERHEIRWFDETGRLVAQRNWTDYPAYCGGKARVGFHGRVPRCASPSREETICGEPSLGVRTPVEDLLLRSGKSPPAISSTGP
jgi:hypothetical protein